MGTYNLKHLHVVGQKHKQNIFTKIKTKLEG